MQNAFKSLWSVWLEMAVLSLVPKGVELRVSRPIYLWNLRTGDDIHNCVNMWWRFGWVSNDKVHVLVCLGFV